MDKVSRLTSLDAKQPEENRRVGAVLLVSPAQRRWQGVGHRVRNSVGISELEKVVKTSIQPKAAGERRVYLSPAASFSMAALRSSAFCCERRRTFLSSCRWSRVPTNSPLTVFIWLSSICVWWREFLLYRRLERTFSSRSSTETKQPEDTVTHYDQLNSGRFKLTEAWKTRRNVAFEIHTHVLRVALSVETGFCLLVQQVFGLFQHLLHLDKLSRLRVAVSSQFQLVLLPLSQLIMILTHLQGGRSAQRERQLKWTQQRPATRKQATSKMLPLRLDSASTDVPASPFTAGAHEQLVCLQNGFSWWWFSAFYRP